MLIKFCVFIYLLIPSFVVAQSFTGTMNSFRAYDHDGDGINEINSLNYVSFDAGSESPSTTSDLVLVLVENRLLRDIPESKYSESDLIDKLEQYKMDLKKDGLESRFVISDIYRKKEHQDGRTILALREWFKSIHKQWNLKGVVLVGSFPDAMLVRRWIWRKNNKDIEINGKPQKGVNYLRIVPEIVSDRSDLVLADLDGNWDKIYVKEKTGLEYIEALPESGLNDNWPNDQDAFLSSSYNIGHHEFEDFFWIQDDDYTLDMAHATNHIKLSLNMELQNPEISPSDRNNRNPIANPEILVSRINSYNIAVRFDDHTFNGLSFLDENGKPRVYESTTKIERASYVLRDRSIERRLLIEYFERNHAFRNGDYTNSYPKAASISYGDGVDRAADLLKYLRKAIQNPQNSFIRQTGSLMDYLSFLQYDATLKGVIAHSSSTSSEFGSVADRIYFERQLGNHIYRWKRTFDGHKYTYTPTLEGFTGRADAYFHRTVYENKLLSRASPCFYIHMGCSVNSPKYFQDRPYSDLAYSTTTGEQNSESILFFAKGLAIASRAKVFNDWPNGFTIELGTSLDKRFGEGLIAYYTKESQNSSLVNNYSQCKRPYTWSIQGDGLLKLRYERIKGE